MTVCTFAESMHSRSAALALALVHSLRSGDGPLPHRLLNRKRVDVHIPPDAHAVPGGRLPQANAGQNSDRQHPRDGLCCSKLSRRGEW